METPDLTRAQWHTSTHSGGNGSCIEVARNLPGIVAVRDSKDRHGPKLILQPAQWHRFASCIKAGHYSNGLSICRGNVVLVIHVAAASSVYGGDSCWRPTARRTPDTDQQVAP